MRSGRRRPRPPARRPGWRRPGRRSGPRRSPRRRTIISRPHATRAVRRQPDARPPGRGRRRGRGGGPRSGVDRVPDEPAQVAAEHQQPARRRARALPEEPHEGSDDRHEADGLVARGRGPGRREGTDRPRRPAASGTITRDGPAERNHLAMVAGCARRARAGQWPNLAGTGRTVRARRRSGPQRGRIRRELAEQVEDALGAVRRGRRTAGAARSPRSPPSRPAASRARPWPGPATASNASTSPRSSPTKRKPPASSSSTSRSTTIPLCMPGRADLDHLLAGLDDQVVAVGLLADAPGSSSSYAASGSVQPAGVHRDGQPLLLDVRVLERRAGAAAAAGRR